jgi:hypothetical protein
MISFLFVILFLYFFSQIHCEEDSRTLDEFKPGEYVVAVEPAGGCANNQCVGVAQIQYLTQYADPNNRVHIPIPTFRQTRQAFITWARHANKQGGLSLNDGSKKFVLLKSFFVTEPTGKIKKIYL